MDFQIEGPQLMQHGFADAIAKVGLQKLLSDLFWIGMFYHLYNQVTIHVQLLYILLYASKTVQSETLLSIDLFKFLLAFLMLWKLVGLQCNASVDGPIMQIYVNAFFFLAQLCDYLKS